MHEAQHLQPGLSPKHPVPHGICVARTTRGVELEEQGRPDFFLWPKVEAAV